MNTNIDPRFNILLENAEKNSFAIEVAEVIQDMLESEELNRGEKSRWFSLKMEMVRVVEVNNFIEPEWLELRLERWDLNY